MLFLVKISRINIFMQKLDKNGKKRPKVRLSRLKINRNGLEMTWKYQNAHPQAHAIKIIHMHKCVYRLRRFGVLEPHLATFDYLSTIWFSTRIKSFHYIENRALFIVSALLRILLCTFLRSRRWYCGRGTQRSYF